MRPTLAQVQASAVPFTVDLVMPFRGVTARTGLLIPGPAGWGEFAPFDDYPPALAARWLAAGLEASYLGWPEPVRDEVAVNAIIAGAEPSDVIAEAKAADGCRTFKIKVGRGDDVERLQALRATVGTEAAIRLDVNAGWTLDQARVLLPKLAAAAGGVEYVEQPVAELADLQQLRELGIPLAVDESLRLSADPFDERLHETIRAAADVAVFKVAPLGGVRAVLRLASMLQMPVVISSAMDTSVGLTAGIAAALALPEEPLACGLGTGQLLATDVIGAPIVPVAGSLSAMTVTPRIEPTEMSAAWQERLAAAWHAGALDLVAW